MSTWSRHYVPGEPRKKGFPFSYEMEQIEQEVVGDRKYTEVDFVAGAKTDISETILEHLMLIFNYYKYLNEFSKDFLGKEGAELPEYFIKVNVFTEVREPQGLTKTGKQRKDKITKVPVNSLFVRTHSFKSDYSYSLIETLDQLKQVLYKPNTEVLLHNEISYDAETSGLDAEFDTIAGINFATEPKKGYYFAVGHDKQFEQYNLPIYEALDIYYDALKKSDTVYMFNSRFDIRFLEYQSYELDETGTNITNKKYDMRDIKFVDTQISMYFADPEHNQRDMAWAEKHFLGYHRPDLKTTLKAWKLETFDTTLIDPRNLLFYAAQDAITTLELGYATNKYITEFGLSGQIDMGIIYPLMDMENRLIRIDTEYLEEQYMQIATRLNKLNKEIQEAIGYGVNLNSPAQKVKLFESFGLDTGVKTKTGNMSTGREAVDEMIERLDQAGKEYPYWLKLLGEQSKLQQMESTFFGNLLGQVDFRDGRVRLNYRHGVTSTGRFSSGAEGKE